MILIQDLGVDSPFFSTMVLFKTADFCGCPEVFQKAGLREIMGKTDRKESSIFEFFGFFQGLGLACQSRGGFSRAAR